MNPTQIPSYSRDEIISYQKLRTFIGLTGILLPILVVFGCYLTHAGENSFQVSISHFYYSKMHIVFTGTLCVLGGFMITYSGKGSWESRVSNIAGYCAFGIASCPTTIEAFHYKGGDNQYLEIISEVTKEWGNVHYVFAGSLFFCFVLFCLIFFQKPDFVYTGEEAVKFRKRRRIYKFCGWTIVVSIGMIAIGPFTYSTFVFETTSLWAFGTAWLVKGSAIWKSVPVAKTLIRSFR